MGKVMDGRGGVDPGGVGGKNFSAAEGGRKIYPRGGGAWVGGSKKIFLARGYFTNKNGLKFFHPGGDFGKNGLPGGVKRSSFVGSLYVQNWRKSTILLQLG